MKTITQSLCCVIPSFMLSRLGNTTDRASAARARATLEQMRELAHQHALTLIDHATPPEPRFHKHRHVYDAQGERILPGKLVLSDHKSTGGDATAREVYDGMAATWDFFYEVYGRNSLDDRGLPLYATVHYGTFQNAMWNGEQVVCGDGDGRIFKPFTPVDVIAHELTHGIVQNTTSIGYSGEAGAVNESLADIFGSLVKQYLLGQTVDQADWLIGAGLFTSEVKARGVRSLASPGKAYNDPILGRDPQPSHLRNYVETEEDNGGVHINSGIPNHAFYRAAMAVGGSSWEVVGRVWYWTMVNALPDEPTFRDLAWNTVDVAGELYGYGSEYQRIVADAWADVGLLVPLDVINEEQMGRRPELSAVPRPTWRPRLSRDSRN